MNTETGELINLAQRGLTPDQAKELGFTVVPKEYEEEANQIISAAELEKIEARADMTADTPLVNWAKSQQMIHKKKTTKKKMASKSRKINRGK